MKKTAISTVLVATLCASPSFAQLPSMLDGFLNNLSPERARKQLEQKQAQERAQAEEEASARKHERALQKQAQEAAWAQRVQELKAGAIEPQTHGDLAGLYAPAIGYKVAEQPLVNPDNKLYIIDGIVEDAGEKGLLVKTRPWRGQIVGHRFVVWYNVETKRAEGYNATLRINGPVSVVGLYTANREIMTLGGPKTIPGFTAVHVMVDAEN